MAYSAGDTILDDEYNIRATGNAAGTGDNSVANVNSVWGTGALDKGYGETGTTLSAVAAGSTITATQWDTLANRMESAAAHQGTSVTAISTISAGDTISVLSAFDSDLTNVFNNRMDATASGATVTTNGSTSTTATWTTSRDSVHRITFASANALRYFFNAGGLVQMTYSRSGGTANSKNTEWTDLCNKMGTITLSGSDSHTVNGTAYTGTTQTGGGAGGAGSTKSTIDAFALTTTNQQLIIKYADTAPYTANYIKVDGKADAAAGSATYIEITSTLVDGAADTGNPSYPAPGTNPGSLDNVDGTLTVAMKFIYPSSTYLTSAAWGTPTMSVTNAI